MSARKRRAFERAEHVAAAAAKQRRVSRIRRGWWVFSCGSRDPHGLWNKVTATARHRDPDTRRTVVRLTVHSPATARDYVITQVPGYLTRCCTGAEARRAGLR